MLVLPRVLPYGRDNKMNGRLRQYSGDHRLIVVARCRGGSDLVRSRVPIPSRTGPRKSIVVHRTIHASSRKCKRLDDPDKKDVNASTHILSVFGVVNLIRSVTIPNGLFTFLINLDEWVGLKCRWLYLFFSNFQNLMLQMPLLDKSQFVF